MATAEQNHLALKTWCDIQQGNDLNLNLNEPPMKNLGNTFIESMDNANEAAKMEAALAYLRDGKIDKVIDIYTKIYTQNKNIKSSLPFLAVKIFFTGDEDTALQLCRIDLKKSHIPHYIKNLLGILEAKADNWLLGEKLIIEAIHEFKTDNTWYGNLILFGQISGKNEVFLQRLIKQAANYGKHQLIFYNAFQLAIENKIDQAISMVEKGYTQLTDQSGWLDFIGWHFVQNGQYDTAYRLMHHERRLKTENTNYQLNYIITLALYDKTTAARQLLSELNFNKTKPIRVGQGLFKAASCSIKELESMLGNKAELQTLAKKTEYTGTLYS